MKPQDGIFVKRKISQVSEKFSLVCEKKGLTTGNALCYASCHTKEMWFDGKKLTRKEVDHMLMKKRRYFLNKI